ncbi:uncharacterized protein LOC105650945 [Jatropha curcas]|uniref:uncharacterized protein LOC105650945 n=1 Tax=Jatropha curcas TaxID=180498 RepID=UPI0005FBA1BF|nr:uncharacterized protein LOC105650945 [Jatropha curcas]
MKLLFAFLFIFLLILFSSTVNARKDVGEYWSREMKDQPPPEALQALVEASTSTKDKADFRTTENHNHATLKAHKLYFETKNDFTNHHNDAGLKKEFDPRLDLSIYQNDVTLKEQTPYFETKNDASIYHDDVALKAKKTFSNDRPDMLIYQSN